LDNKFDIAVLAIVAGFESKGGGCAFGLQMREQHRLIMVAVGTAGE
jgi:hypothetical protein